MGAGEPCSGTTGELLTIRIVRRAMLKLLLGGVGLVETLYPERFMQVVTRLSYEYDGDAPTPKPWVVTAARLEGLVILTAVIWSALKTDCNCSLLSRDDEIDANTE